MSYPWEIPLCGYVGLVSWYTASLRIDTLAPLFEDAFGLLFLQLFRVLLHVVLELDDLVELVDARRRSCPTATSASGSRSSSPRSRPAGCRLGELLRVERPWRGRRARRAAAVIGPSFRARSGLRMPFSMRSHASWPPRALRRISVTDSPRAVPMRATSRWTSRCWRASGTACSGAAGREQLAADLLRLRDRLAEPGPLGLLAQEDLAEQLLGRDDAERDRPRHAGLRAGVVGVGRPAGERQQRAGRQLLGGHLELVLVLGFQLDVPGCVRGPSSAIAPSRGGGLRSRAASPTPGRRRRGGLDALGEVDLHKPVVVARLHVQRDPRLRRDALADAGVLDRDPRRLVGLQPDRHRRRHGGEVADGPDQLEAELHGRSCVHARREGAVAEPAQLGGAGRFARRTSSAPRRRGRWTSASARARLRQERQVGVDAGELVDLGGGLRRVLRR